MNFEQWHQAAAKGQTLVKSALNALRNPETRPQAVKDGQAMFDHLLNMGFKAKSRETAQGPDGRGPFKDGDGSGH